MSISIDSTSGAPKSRRGRPSADTSRARWTCTSGEMMALFGVDKNGLRKLAMEGCPKAGNGKWYLGDVLQWLLARDAPVVESLDMKERRAALFEAQEQRQRIEIAIRLGHLLPAEDVQQIALTLAQNFVDLLDALPARVDLPAAEERRLEQEIRSARQDLADAVLAAGRDLAELRADLSAAATATGVAVGGSEAAPT